MTPVIRMMARPRTKRTRRPAAGPAAEQQFRFPGPDTVAELPCDPGRRRQRRQADPPASRRLPE